MKCPRCHSKKLRVAGWYSITDKLLGLLGFVALRCQACRHAFRAHELLPSRAFYAKCPRCYRSDLATWDPKYYRARTLESFKLWLGGNRWRCEACRCNFVSFRPRQEKYRRRKAGHSEAECQPVS